MSAKDKKSEFILPTGTEANALDIETLIPKFEKAKTLKKWLLNLEKEKENVKSYLYEKVKTDYQTNLTEITNYLEEKRCQIIEGIQTLKIKTEEVECAYTSQEEDLEEFLLRCRVGEFEGPEIETGKNKKQKALNEKKQELSMLKKMLQDHEDVLGTYYADGLYSTTEEYDYLDSEQERKEVFDATEITANMNMEESEKTKIDGLCASNRENFLESSEHTKYLSREKMNLDDQIEGKSAFLILQGGTNKKFVVPKSTVTIGRGSNNNIHLLDKSISRKHAKLSYANGKYTIEDIHSSSGILLNGKKISSAVLEDNNLISLGKTKMIFRLP